MITHLYVSVLCQFLNVLNSFYVIYNFCLISGNTIKMPKHKQGLKPVLQSE